MIDLSDFSEDITSILHDLAQSDLNLQGLDLSKQNTLPFECLREIASNKRNFRILKCSRLSILRDDELIAIAHAFPLLEELDISYPAYASAVTDDSIEALSRKLPNLAKINIAGNAVLSDECLLSLASNCANLREVVFHHCEGITQVGVAALIKNSLYLAGLSLALAEGFSPTFSISFSGLKFLSTLEFSYMQIPDQMLFSIADSKIPLKRFGLCHCKDFSTAGVIYFLHKYHSLESITLAEIDFLDDSYLQLFSQFFKRMSSITLNCCPKLTEESFYTLLTSCPLLENVEMANTGAGNHGSIVGLNRNFHPLDFSGRLGWWEDKMKIIAVLRHKLMYLDMSGSSYLSHGIVLIMENCKRIRHLKINRCQDMIAAGSTCKFERLEILDAASSTISNRSLSVFAKRSPMLRRLNLKNCRNITALGVQTMVENCQELVEINIMLCKIEPEFVHWMMDSKPRLRLVVTRHCLHDQFRQLNPFLRNVCPFCSN